MPSTTAESTSSEPFPESDHLNMRNDSHESSYIAWRPPITSSTTHSIHRTDPIHHHHYHRNDNNTHRDPAELSSAFAFDPALLPGGKISLSGISTRAFFLGLVLGVSSLIATLLAWHSIRLWRVPFFISSLCVFHFLEFWVTAQYNTRNADTSAYLLGSNGAAYNIAHGSAVVECLVSHWAAPNGYIFGPESRVSAGLVLVGMVMVFGGQTVRTLAMVTAGDNFNHIVQTERDTRHRLVTNGIYSLLRHPSYFGFFWWGLGTQLVLQNVVCFVGFTIVLWRFFRSRIEREERHLVAFFRNDYIEYKKRTPVGIPLIP